MIFAANPRGWAIGLTSVLLVQAAVVVGTSSHGWWGWLPPSGAALERTSLWGAGLTAGATAILAGNVRWNHAENWVLSGGRAPVEIYAPVFWLGLRANLAVVSGVGVLVAIAGHGGATASTWFRFALSIAAILGAAACACGFGVAMGRWLPAWLAPLVAMAIPYLTVLAIGVYAADSPISMLLVPDLLAYEYSWPTTTAATGRAGCAALAGLAVLLVVGTNRPAAARLLRWGSSLAAVLAVLGGGAVVDIPSATSVTCSGQQPEVCFDGTQSAMRAEYWEGVLRARAHLPSEIVPARVSATPLLTEGALLVVPGKGKYQPARRASGAEVAAQLGERLFESRCSGPAAQDRSQMLIAWWRLQIGAPLAGGTYPGQVDLDQPSFARVRSAAHALAARPRGEQQEVVRTETTRLMACSAAK